MAIGNTGGDGVSIRYDCDDAARVSAFSGWADGTAVEVLAEGRGRCAGWLWLEADGVTSWVREQYVVGFAGDQASQSEAGLVIGNTGGDGVAHRNECDDAARLAVVGGWADGTAVEVAAVGRGACDGWLWVEAAGVTSWVREQYVVEPPAAVEPAPAPEEAAAPADEAPADETPVPADETPVPADETPVPADETTAPADETPVPADETPADGTPAPADETPADETPSDPAPASRYVGVIGNTGGDGVSHRNECRDDARLSDIGGWADGTAVDVIEDGSGTCAGWLRVRANGVTSWVREQYVVDAATAATPAAAAATPAAAAASPAASPSAATPTSRSVGMIGNTSGEGVSHRNDCLDNARASVIGGWADGTEVEVLEDGSGRCAGWLWVQAFGATSWVREQYVVESGAAAPQRWRSVANTGGFGVSYRNDCRDDARVAAVGGWSDGAEVEVIEEGRGRCTGWVRVQADDVTSWVREEYLLAPRSPALPSTGGPWGE